jgi:hypothetical protein
MDVHDEDFENVDPGEVRVLLEEGCWPAECLGRENKPYSGLGEKLTFKWKVFLSPDKNKFVILPRYYNAPRNKAGRFKFGQLSAFRNDWVTANNGKVPLDRNRLPPSIWQKGTFLVEVITVRRTRSGVLSPSLYWSRIGRVIRPMAEDERWEGLPVQRLDSQC